MIKNLRNLKLYKRYIIILLLVALVGCSLYLFTKVEKTSSPHDEAGPGTSSQVSDIDYSPATAEDKKAADDSKTSSNKPAANGTTQTSPSIAVSIISMYQDDNHDLVVKTRLSGSGWQKCTLVVTIGQKVTTKSAETVFQPEFSTCAGYVIPFSELTAGSAAVLLSASNSDGSNYKGEQKVITIVK
jgi:hypothetical protein